MKFIEFDENKCDSCYKCLRICPTKAISFNKDQRSIIDNLCIKCGLCSQSCPQEALHIRSSAGIIRTLVADGHDVAVSIAPSFAGAFGLDNPLRVVGGLRQMGVKYIEETAIGAEMVAREYDRYIEENEQGVYITSCCPSANYLIEQHFPYLISSVIPVVSPMIAHGKSMKQRYGEDTKVVFVGPCMAKMAEAEELSGAIDYVVTFDEIYQLQKALGRNFRDCKPSDFDATSYSRGRAFPLGGSLQRHNEGAKELRPLRVDGIDACKSVLSEIRNGSVNNCCVEINICEGSCMNGPDMPKNHMGRFARELYMKQYVDSGEEAVGKPITGDLPEMARTFKDKQSKEQEPNIQIVRNVMAQMGKYTEEDELNCGACGYKTCYDKAKAVFMGYSDIETCLPYLREKAESMQNIMIESSPNAVIMMDHELNIKEVNPSFKRMLNKDNLPFEEMPIKLFVDHPIFGQVLETKESVQNKKIHIPTEDTYFLTNIVYLEETGMMLAFLTDISNEEQSKQEFIRLREETLQKTQDVIDKQMRVAQEIASLLGETTAETKMSLKSLNELVQNDWRTM